MDCVLAGYAKVEKDEIFIFDDKLKKMIVINKYYFFNIIYSYTSPTAKIVNKC